MKSRRWTTRDLAATAAGRRALGMSEAPARKPSRIGVANGWEKSANAELIAPRIKSGEVKRAEPCDGTFDGRIDPDGGALTGEPVKALALLIAEIFTVNGGRNFLTFTIDYPERDDLPFTSLAVTIQKVGAALTPAVHIAELESESAALRSRVEALEGALVEALVAAAVKAERAACEELCRAIYAEHHRLAELTHKAHDINAADSYFERATGVYRCIAAIESRGNREPELPQGCDIRACGTCNGAVQRGCAPTTDGG